MSPEGFSFNPATHVLKVHHVHSAEISIEGEGGGAPPMVVDFDNPSLPAGTILRGEYPSGVANWGNAGAWRIAVPEGRLATFNLAAADPGSHNAEFGFDTPRLFVGADVFNRGPKDVTLKIHSPTNPDFTAVIPPGELLRLHTAWRNSSPRIRFETEGAATLGDLRFDNLAYTPITPAAGP